MAKQGGGLPDLSNMMGMLQNAQKQAEKMKQRMESSLREKTVEGTTGTWRVHAAMSGTPSRATQAWALIDGPSFLTPMRRSDDTPCRRSQTHSTSERWRHPPAPGV